MLIYEYDTEELVKKRRGRPSGSGMVEIMNSLDENKATKLPIKTRPNVTKLMREFRNMRLYFVTRSIKNDPGFYELIRISEETYLQIKELEKKK